MAIDLIGHAPDQVSLNEWFGRLAFVDTYIAPEAPRIINSTTQSVVMTTYIVTSALTLTLPPAPSPGDWVDVCNLTGSASALVIGRSGRAIESLAEDMTVNVVGARFRLLWSGDDTRGWVIK